MCRFKECSLLGHDSPHVSYEQKNSVPRFIASWGFCKSCHWIVVGRQVLGGEVGFTKSSSEQCFFLVDVLLDDYVSPSLKFNIKFGSGNRQKGANFGQWSPNHHGFRGCGIGRCMFPDVNRRTSGKCFGPFGPVLRTCLLKKLSQKGVSWYRLLMAGRCWYLMNLDLSWIPFHKISGVFNPTVWVYHHVGVRECVFLKNGWL